MFRILLEWPPSYGLESMEVIVPRIPAKGDLVRLPHPQMAGHRAHTEVSAVFLDTLPSDTLMFEFVGIAAKVVCK